MREADERDSALAGTSATGEIGGTGGTGETDVNTFTLRQVGQLRTGVKVDS